eukprot:366157-Chlamydomonas_euryale.AAC.12
MQVKERRGVANPNIGFTCQLLQWQKRRSAPFAPPSSRLRLLRVAPHCPQVWRCGAGVARYAR